MPGHISGNACVCVLLFVNKHKTPMNFTVSYRKYVMEYNVVPINLIKSIFPKETSEIEISSL